MSQKCLTLHMIDEQVFAEIGQDYLLYICELETYQKLNACQIVLLVNATIADHMGPRHVH